MARPSHYRVVRTMTRENLSTEKGEIPQRRLTLRRAFVVSPDRAPKRMRTFGTRCIWPRGLLERYGVSAPTLWRWERTGKLPERDVYIGGRAVGWRPETIERAERGPMTD